MARRGELPFALVKKAYERNKAERAMTRLLGNQNQGRATSHSGLILSVSALTVKTTATLQNDSGMVRVRKLLLQSERSGGGKFRKQENCSEIR